MDSIETPKTKRILFKAKRPLDVTKEEGKTEKEVGAVAKGLIFELISEEDVYLNDPSLRLFLEGKPNVNLSCIPGYRVVERTLEVLNSSSHKHRLTFRCLHDDVNQILDNFEEVTEDDIEVLKLLYDFDEYTDFCMVQSFRNLKGWKDI